MHHHEIRGGLVQQERVTCSANLRLYVSLLVPSTYFFWLQSSPISADFVAPSLAKSAICAKLRWVRALSRSIIRVRSSRPQARRLFANITRPRSLASRSKSMADISWVVL